MANAICRGCTQSGWLGLVDGIGGAQWHERVTGHGKTELIPCVAKIKKPAKVKSWRTCPNCGSKATKIISATTGLITCQICGHGYSLPSHSG